MSVTLTAQLIYVHTSYLFWLHVKGIIPGSPIPTKYTVHAMSFDEEKHSTNLTLTCADGPVDVEELRCHIQDLKIFGEVKVGTFGITRLTTAA